ncbi:MAG: ATP-binding protein [Thermoproteota archaeon]|nr:ATP-binding protein [Thermoproteota archaeon]
MMIYFNQSLLQKKDLLNRSPYRLHETEKNGAEYTSISHVYEPLNKFLDMLLPYLKFARVDISDTDPPKCIFSKYTHSGISHSPNQVDIHKLSRGEIRVISQFLPLAEHRILRKLVPRSDRISFSDIVVLMDMPDLHLPSQLQSRLIEYFRSIVREENEKIQFIIVTNSSALIDKSTAEEFKLMPSRQLDEGSNLSFSNKPPISQWRYQSLI